MGDKTLLTLTEAIEKLHISRATMYRLIKSGAIKPIRFTPKGAYRFNPNDLEHLTSNGKKGN